MFVTGAYAQAQNKAHEEYLKAYESIEQTAMDRVEELNELYMESPHLRDSIIPMMRQVGVDMAKSTYELLKGYAAEPWSAEEFCAIMFDLGKEGAAEFYAMLPDESARSEYGRDIKRYLELETVKKGGMYFDFEARTPDGATLRLSDIMADRDVLLILDGHYCMGDEAIEFLKECYAGIDRRDLEFVSVALTDSETDWLGEVDHFALPWPFVSDMRGEHSDIGIAYAVRATPTFAYIRRGGEVEMMGEGLGSSLQRKLISMAQEE